VSLNGVIQKPQGSFQVSNSTIVFDSALTSSDSIDFILAERAITLTTVGSGSVGTSQLADNAVTTSKISIPDDAVLNIGTGNDLAIYHESSSNKSYIKESGSADLVIAGNDILFRNTDDTETMAYFQNNGAVTLKYDHSTKFATTSTGIDVTGAITVNGSALASGLGVGQSWQTPSRSVNTTYTNSTGKPIAVAVNVFGNNTTTQSGLRVDGSAIDFTGFEGGGTYTYMFQAVVPNGSTYEFDANSGYSSLAFWRELR
jgi:hypothetical protein